MSSNDKVSPLFMTNRDVLSIQEVFMQKDELFSIIEEDWKKEKALDLKDFLKRLKCSTATVRRRLKKWKTITSFNHKGRYYTLFEIADFTNDGLWFYNDIGFSQHGNLIETITYFISSSNAGLYANNLFELLHFKSYSILSRIMDKTSLHREKMHDKYIYFSADEAKRKIQISERFKINQMILAEEISTSKGINILVEYIKHPSLSFTELSENLSKQGVFISDVILHSFFEFHGILKKTHNFKQL